VIPLSAGRYYRSLHVKSSLRSCRKASAKKPLFSQSWLGFVGVPACVSRGTRRGAPIQGRNKWVYQAGRRLGRPLRALFDDPCDVLVPPGSAAAGTPSLPVQGSRNPSQRLATLTQATDLAQRCLLARIRLDVLAVRRQPVDALDCTPPKRVHGFDMTQVPPMRFPQ
jgi:hypothetical protein